MSFQRVTLSDENRAHYSVKVYGTRGEIEAWIRFVLASELQQDTAVCNPQSLKRAVCKIAGTLVTKRGPMGKRGKPTIITLPPDAAQFAAACEKLSLRISAMTDTTGNLPRVELVEKIS